MRQANRRNVPAGTSKASRKAFGWEKQALRFARGVVVELEANARRHRRMFLQEHFEWTVTQRNWRNVPAGTLWKSLPLIARDAKFEQVRILHLFHFVRTQWGISMHTYANIGNIIRYWATLWMYVPLCTFLIPSRRLRSSSFLDSCPLASRDLCLESTMHRENYHCFPLSRILVAFIRTRHLGLRLKSRQMAPLVISLARPLVVL
jgi:hypothetical protein